MYYGRGDPAPFCFLKKHLQFFRECVIMSMLNMEAYRSGHNGTDSKSVVLSGTEGSNPSASAKLKLGGDNSLMSKFALQAFAFP